MYILLYFSLTVFEMLESKIMSKIMSKIIKFNEHFTK